MKKKLLGLALVGGVAALAATALTSCSDPEVFHIYAWNDEFQNFFYDHFATKKGDDYYVNDVKVKFTIVPNEDGAYQNALDKALNGNEKAKKSDKVDMFLAEADYILKYTDSDRTQDIKPLGVTNFSNTYTYTVEAASDSKGTVKGVSFQCCPSAMIYRRSLMKEVIGTDDPAEVQKEVDTWEKYEALAAKAKAKDIYITASFAETYRPFSNNVSTPWVTSDNKINIDANITAWMNQQENFMKKGYILNTCPGVWDGGKNDQMYKDGKTLTFFGPAWYYNFCMGNALDETKGTNGDWAITAGPMAHFWGGTWLLAATGADNTKEVADTMNAFINDEKVCEALVTHDAQFTNNQKVNNKFANDPTYGNKFLGGQNDTAVFAELAKNIKFQNPTNYDQLANEKIQEYFGTYLKYLGNVEGIDATTREAQLDAFYDKMIELYPELHK